MFSNFSLTGLRSALILIGTTLAVWLSFRYLLSLIVPFLFAFIFAHLLRPVVGWLHTRLHLPVIISSILSMLVFFSVISLGIFALTQSLISQLIEFCRKLPFYHAYCEEQFGIICTGCDHLFRLENGSSLVFFESRLQGVVDSLQSTFIPSLTQYTVKIALGTMELAALLIIFIISTLLILKDIEVYRAAYANSRFYARLHPLTDKLVHSGWAYVRSEFIVILLVAASCSVGLLLIGNAMHSLSEYA